MDCWIVTTYTRVKYVLIPGTNVYVAEYYDYEIFQKTKGIE